MKILIRTLSSPTLLEDLTQLDAVLATEGWQTLMTFTRESARAFLNFGFWLPGVADQYRSCETFDFGTRDIDYDG